MTPVRWTTDYAATVREALVARVEQADTAPLVVPAARGRTNVLRVVVAFAIALALIVPASVFAFSHGGRTVAAPSPGPIAPGQPDLGAALIGLWKVAADGEGDQTWIVLGAGSFEIERDRWTISGSWRTGDEVLISRIYGGSGGAPNLDASWLTDATSFAVRGDDRVLLGRSGETLATLTPAERAPTPRDAIAEVMEPPADVQSARAELAVPTPPAVPGGALTMKQLIGTWIAGPAATAHQAEPSLQLKADGEYGATDGCNGSGGGWKLFGANRFVATSGPIFGVGCYKPVDVLGWAVQARSVSLIDGTLTLFDQSGKALGTLHRK